MSYEHIDNNHKIIFKNEIAYLDCKKEYLEHPGGFIQFTSFIELFYIHNHREEIENIEHIVEFVINNNIPVGGTGENISGGSPGGSFTTVYYNTIGTDNETTRWGVSTIGGELSWAEADEMGRVLNTGLPSIDINSKNNQKEKKKNKKNNKKINRFELMDFDE